MALTPPRAARKPVIHSLHGEDRPDDYHWLRTQGRADPEVLAYLHAENAHLNAVMAPLRDMQGAIYRDLLSHVQERDEGAPVREGGGCTSPAPRKAGPTPSSCAAPWPGAKRRCFSI